MRDKVIIYDDVYDPAVSGAIGAGASADLATLDAGEHLFVIEEMYVWSPYNGAGDPADLDNVQILIDGEPYPATPSRLRIRAMAERCMAPPYDPRFPLGPYPFGKISLDPLKDTTIKVTPAQRLAVRLNAGTTTGIQATDTVTRIQMRGRIADEDEELQNIYGGSMYQPGGAVRVGDPVTGKVTPGISKSFPLTIDNAKYMSGATGQQAPKITPFWTYGVNNTVIPATPEFEWTYTNPDHLNRSWEEMSFDWTRIESRALQIENLSAYIAAGEGTVFLHQPPLRRPGHLNQFYGWTVDAGYPNLIPGGGGPGMTGAGMFQGPFELNPKILAFNNLTEVRVEADAGTTIAVGDLELQLRGVFMEF